MGLQSLGSRAIIGEFFRRLSINSGAAWIPFISMLFDSDQDSETYNWLGQTAAMREWIGGRDAKAFAENGITIENKHYEATIEVLVRQMRRDKTGQGVIRIQELAGRTVSHWASLLTTLISNGTSSVCYDGEFFFDTDHKEGKNTTNQSNDIQTDISELPAAVHGAAAATPSPEEAQQVIHKSIAQIMSFKDNENEPMNEDASSFLVMVPTSLNDVFTAARVMPHGTGVTEQQIQNSANVSVVQNARLTDTDAIYVFRTDGDVKPFIRQEETAVNMKAKAEGSEYEFDNDAWQFGVDAWRNVGYGYWQHAVYNQMI